MKPRHLNTFRALIAIGFSGFTASIIILDAQRGGNPSALMFARIAIRANRNLKRHSTL